jgi:hypothetical protein
MRLGLWKGKVVRVSLVVESLGVGWGVRDKMIELWEKYFYSDSKGWKIRRPESIHTLIHR